MSDAFIIAEIGSNFSSKEDCVNSIIAAKRAGADAVKYQAFSFQALYGFSPKELPKGYDRAYELPLEWLPELRSYADREGIEFMCTAFDPSTLRHLDQYVTRHKIASSDLCHVDLLRAAADCRKPVILSTGAASSAEISAALTYLEGCDVTLMYCVSAYPATSVNLFKIDMLREEFGFPVGYSDHSRDPVYIPLAAARLHKAAVIEKHMTILSKPTPDSRHSVTPVEFKAMVDYIRGARQFYLGPTSEERDMILKHRRRLIVTTEIAKGQRFDYGSNYGAYRSVAVDLNALSPLAYQEVQGRVATRDLKPGDGVGFGDFL